MVAVVSGGSSGIGRSIADRLAAEGVHVAALSRSAGLSRSAASTPEDNPSPAGQSAVSGVVPWAVPCDVRDEESVRAAFDAVSSRFGRVDILVNAAGVSMPEYRELSETEPDLWRKLVDTNLTGLYLVTHFFMPHLRTAGGYIINILSTAAFRSNPGNAAYSASKYGARAVAETAALEGKDSGVRVASISPGPVNTNIWNHKTKPPEDDQRSHMLDPEDICDIALFLLRTPGYVVIDNVTVTPLQFP